MERLFPVKISEVIYLIKKQIVMMKRMISAIFVFLSLVILISCNSGLRKPNKKSEVKNVILLIGDGMGLATLHAAMTTSTDALFIESFPVTGLQKTSSLTDYITDSAAAGTAISTGKKTKNGVIGQDTLGNRFSTILEIAEEKGLATGLVSTSAITHATPAAFIAHASSRNSYEEIAMDFLETDIDVFIGGGLNHFYRRSDGLNLLDSLTGRGYQVDTTIESILLYNGNKLAGFTAPVYNPYRLQGRGDMLPRAAEKAISILSKDSEGFFLMIEGSQIDWAGHDNDSLHLIDETLDFDQAVGIALDYARKNGNTLVVVTADHETGGVTITDGNMQDHFADVHFSSGDHTAVMVPVFAFGPGSEKFSGIYENTGLFDRISELFGF